MKYKIIFDKVPEDSDEDQEKTYESFKQFAHAMTYHDSKDVTVEKIPEGDELDEQETISLLHDVLTQIEMDLVDDKRDLRDQASNELNDLVKVGLKRREYGIGDAVDRVRYWTDLITGETLTECCDAPLEQQGCFGPSMCSECESINFDWYKVKPGIEDIVEEVDWK